jgi:hypothetical protein
MTRKCDAPAPSATKSRKSQTLICNSIQGIPDKTEMVTDLDAK